MNYLEMNYEIVPKKMLANLIKNLKWEKSRYGHYGLGVQGFGMTDYKDHTNDKLETLKKLVLKNLEKSSSQVGHFCDSDGDLVDSIMVHGFRGGYTASFIYKSGANGFNRK